MKRGETTVRSVMVVEDDVALSVALAASLSSHGYDVVGATSAEEAIMLVEQRLPDLVLLDLTLPGAGGLQVLRRLRSFNRMPVLILAARDDRADKLAALDGGADDYVDKPFDVGELLARVRAALRRRPDSADLNAAVRVGNVEIDRARWRVAKDGEDIHLTPAEFRFLELLVTSDGRLVTYAEAARQISATKGGELDLQALGELMWQLRRKLGDDAADPQLLVTHVGLGFRWIAGDNGDSW